MAISLGKVERAMRDPAYYILFGIIIFIIIDYFAFNGAVLTYFGRSFNNTVSWLAGLMGG